MQLPLIRRRLAPVGSRTSFPRDFGCSSLLPTSPPIGGEFFATSAARRDFNHQTPHPPWWLTRPPAFKPICSPTPRNLPSNLPAHYTLRLPASAMLLPGRTRVFDVNRRFPWTFFSGDFFFSFCQPPPRKFTAWRTPPFFFPGTTLTKEMEHEPSPSQTHRRFAPTSRMLN